MIYWQTGTLISQLFPDVVSRIKTTEKKLYLTFDDGPEPESTTPIIELLGNHQIKATFFCLGENANKYPDLLQAMVKNGHAIGNHGFKHLDGWKTANNTYITNAEKGAEVTGSRLFRPPYGRMKPAQLRTLLKKYHIIYWDVMSYDFKVPSPEKCIHIVKKQTGNGSIIVFHDLQKTKEIMLPVLTSITKYYLAKGFGFDILPLD